MTFHKDFLSFYRCLLTPFMPNWVEQNSTRKFNKNLLCAHSKMKKIISKNYVYDSYSYWILIITIK